MRVDRADLALIGGELGRALLALGLLLGQFRDARLGRGSRNAGDAFCFSASRSCSTMRALLPCRRRLLGKLHIGEPPLSTSTSIWRPERLLVDLGLAREERHVDVDQQAEVGLARYAARLRIRQKHGPSCADVVDHVGFEHADAGELREPFDRVRRAGRAAGIGRRSGSDIFAASSASASLSIRRGSAPVGSVAP